MSVFSNSMPVEQITKSVSKCSDPEPEWSKARSSRTLKMMELAPRCENPVFRRSADLRADIARLKGSRQGLGRIVR